MPHIARWSLAAVAAVPLSIGAIVLGPATVAGAAPIHAPTATEGMFTCGTGRAGTFVTNSGNATATPPNVAHLQFSTGARGIFVPTSLSLTISFTAVTPTSGTIIATTTFSVTSMKGNGHAPSSDTCSISSTDGPFVTPTTGFELTYTLSGTVVGKIVTNG